MSGVVRQELLFFAVSLLTGMALTASYGILRLLRRFIAHRPAVVSVEDFLYWCAAAFCIFAMMFEKNDGALRGYAFAGILLGAWLEWAIESFFRRIWIKILKKRKKRGKITNNTAD